MCGFVGISFLRWLVRRTGSYLEVMISGLGARTVHR
jgi:hypothetical protein